MAVFDANMMGQIENVESVSDLDILNEQFTLRKQAAIEEVGFSYFFND